MIIICYYKKVFPASTPNQRLCVVDLFTNTYINANCQQICKKLDITDSWSVKSAVKNCSFGDHTIAMSDFAISTLKQ